MLMKSLSLCHSVHMLLKLTPCYRYTQNLQAVLKEGIRKAVVSGLAGGMFWLAVFSIFALSFWYGAKLTREDCLNPGAIIQV